MDFDFSGANISQVSEGIETQIVGDRKPDGALPALTPILVHEAGQRPAFADAGSVADQKSGTSPIRQNLLVLHRRVRYRLQLGVGFESKLGS